MFAMGSLIFQMEHGAKPELSVDNHGRLVLPTIRTDHPSLDSIIQKAWLGHYSRTSEMLESLNCIDTNGVRHAHVVQLRSRSTESLRDRIRKWREYRENKFGCVLNGVLLEDQLQSLSDCYGLDKDADLRFTECIGQIPNSVWQGPQYDNDPSTALLPLLAFQIDVIVPLLGQ